MSSNLNFFAKEKPQSQGDQSFEMQQIFCTNPKLRGCFIILLITYMDTKWLLQRFQFLLSVWPPLPGLPGILGAVWVLCGAWVSEGYCCGFRWGPMESQHCPLLFHLPLPLWFGWWWCSKNVLDTSWLVIAVACLMAFTFSPRSSSKSISPSCGVLRRDWWC